MLLPPPFSKTIHGYGYESAQSITCNADASHTRANTRVPLIVNMLSQKCSKGPPACYTSLTTRAERVLVALQPSGLPCVRALGVACERNCLLTAAYDARRSATQAR